MLKKINTFLLTLLLFITASSAFGAPSEIIVTDCDPEGVCSNYGVDIVSYPPGQENPHMATSDYLGWNRLGWDHGPDPHNLTNPPELAGLPGKEIFAELLSADTAPVEVRVHMRLTLPLETAYYHPDDHPYDAHKWRKQIALTYYTNANRGRIEFSQEALADIVPEEQLKRLVNDVEQLVVVGADGKLQTIEAKARPVPVWRDDKFIPYYIVYTKSYGNIWDTQSTFPMTVYGVSYKYLEHEITVTQPSHGTIAPIEESGIVKVKHGEDAKFTITADGGYRIAHLLVDGERIEVKDRYLCNYTFKAVDKPHTISALFEEDKNAPEISADSGVSGSVVNLIESASDAAVSEFENGGFMGGGKTVHVVNLDRDTKTEGTFAADADGFVQAVKLSVEYEEGAESQGLTLTVRPLDAAKPFSADKSYCALLLNKKTNYYDVFPAARGADGNLTVKIRPVGDYFSEGTIFVYSGTVTDGGTPADPVTPGGGSGSKSGSGCAAGVAALALLALVPIAAGKRR